MTVRERRSMAVSGLDHTDRAQARSFAAGQRDEVELREPADDYDRLFRTSTPVERAAVVVYGLDDAGGLDRASLGGLVVSRFGGEETQTCMK